MKNLNITFTDAEFNRLKRAKKEYNPNYSWETFILVKCAPDLARKKNNHNITKKEVEKR